MSTEQKRARLLGCW